MTTITRIPVVTAMLDDAMRAWLEQGAPMDATPGRKAEGVAQTDAEIDAIMTAISVSVDFRKLRFLMDWDILGREWRKMIGKWKGETMKGEILSVTPAPGWCALLRAPNDAMLSCPLIGWALMRRDGTNTVCGMVVNVTGEITPAESLPDFLGYAPTSTRDAGVWADVVRQIVARAAVPPVTP